MKNSIFSDRITDVPKSFIREILKVTVNPSVISFAGGLPNRNLFPVQEIRKATENIFSNNVEDLFQYGNSEGLLSLRETIAERYYCKYKLDIPVDNILITSGSQQGLDLLGKVFLNPGDSVLIEEPGYLGAIQAFSIYQPNFLPVPVSEAGMDTTILAEQLLQTTPKLMYTVPNFQNPSGISYPEENRKQIVEQIKNTQTLLIEDDPYGDLRFSGKPKVSFYELLPNSTILLGSFSKIIIPGFRIGWMVAPQPVMQKVITAKQATDLHTSHFTQAIISNFLDNYDMNDHIKKIVNAYGAQCSSMISAIEKYFPKEVKTTSPEGGMFLWATLPAHISSLELFKIASSKNVVFVPGDPFYINKTQTNAFRLNFSCADSATIEEGIARIGTAIQTLL